MGDSIRAQNDKHIQAKDAEVLLGDAHSMWISPHAEAVAHIPVKLWSDLYVRLEEFLLNAYTNSDNATYASTLNNMLDQANLTYTKLFESLPNRLLQRAE